MRIIVIILLAVSAISLLAIGTDLSFRASRSATASPSVMAEAAAAAPSLPAGDIAVDEHAPTIPPAPAAPVEQPTAATIVRVRTVRIDPERPPARAEDRQDLPAQDLPAQDLSAQDLPASGGASRREAASIDNAPGKPRVASSAPAPVLPTHEPAKSRDKPRFVGVRKSSHAHRKMSLPAEGPAANDALSYAPKEPGPESLNPLGKLLTGGFKAN